MSSEFLSGFLHCVLFCGAQMLFHSCLETFFNSKENVFWQPILFSTKFIFLFHRMFTSRFPFLRSVDLIFQHPFCFVACLACAYPTKRKRLRYSKYCLIYQQGSAETKCWKQKLWNERQSKWILANPWTKNSTKCEIKDCKDYLLITLGSFLRKTLLLFSDCFHANNKRHLRIWIAFLETSLPSE